MRCYADVIGMPISVIGSDQGPAWVGDARGGRRRRSRRHLRRRGGDGAGPPRRLRPDPARARAYDELYAIYDALHDHFGVRRRDLMRELMAIRERGAAVAA